MNSDETTHAANPLDDITAALEKALHQASQQAEQTINDARTQADAIINDAQADARYRDDMERASLAIQEHAAALHTLALGLARHETTPHDNADDNATSGDVDTGTNTDTNETDTANNASPNSANTHSTDAIPPAPTATDPDNATTAASRANAPTTRRANGTTRKLAPWETPEPETTTGNDATRPKPTPTARADTNTGNTTRADTKQDAPAPQWDAPLIIDAPLQL